MPRNFLFTYGRKDPDVTRHSRAMLQIAATLLQILQHVVYQAHRDRYSSLSEARRARKR
jgi:hypothetical protein